MADVLHALKTRYGALVAVVLMLIPRVVRGEAPEGELWTFDTGG